MVVTGNQLIIAPVVVAVAVAVEAMAEEVDSTGKFVGTGKELFAKSCVTYSR